MRICLISLHNVGRKKVLAVLFTGKHGLSARLAMYGNKIIAISYQVEELTY